LDGRTPCDDLVHRRRRDDPARPSIAGVVLNPLDYIVGWIRRYLPENPSRFVMPYLVILLTLVAILSAFDARNRSTDVQRFSEDLRMGLIASCEQNGSPLRNAIQLIILDDIQQTQAFIGTKEGSQLFPTVPPRQLDALLRDTVRDNRRILATIPDVDCQATFAVDEDE